MEMEPKRVWKRARIVQRLVLGLIALLLVGVPFVDFAWNEPALEAEQGARCQLHANPGASLEPAPLVVTCSFESFLPSDPLAQVPLRGASVFIPPRA
jgi:hypothetical protein